MAKNTPNNIVRKQSKIDQTRQTVLYWVMGASALVGMGVVIIALLMQTMIYNQRVIGEKNKTVRTLTANIEAAKELKDKINKLNTNEELKAVQVSDSAQAVQSILDALPADANDLALGASLQDKLLKDIPGLKIQQIQITPTSGAGGNVAASNSENSITFSLTISGTPDALQEALKRLERSIRAIDVVNITASTSGKELTMQISATAPYQPPALIELQSKKVPPLFGDGKGRSK